MSATRRFFLWAIITTSLILAAASIVSAFFGSAATRTAFSSAPAAAFWLIFMALMVASVAAFPAVRQSPGLLATHVGPLLILAGAIWASPAAHRLRGWLTDSYKPPAGRMVIYQGQSSRELFPTEGGAVERLPFEVALEKFWIEYYPDEPWLLVMAAVDEHDEDEHIHQELVDWQLGQEVALPLCDVTMRVADYRLVRFSDGPDAWVMPKLAVRLTGDDTREYALQAFPHMPQATLPLAGVYADVQAWMDAGMPRLYLLASPTSIKDYRSSLVITDQREPDHVLTARKTIEVNSPMHYGGYHFYQYQYDDEAHQYTILSVYSDSGLYVAYTGFAMLCGGMLWHVIWPAGWPGRRRAA